MNKSIKEIHGPFTVRPGDVLHVVLNGQSESIIVAKSSQIVDTWAVTSDGKSLHWFLGAGDNLTEETIHKSMEIYGANDTNGPACCP